MYKSFFESNLPLLSHHVVCFLSLRDIYALSLSSQFFANMIHSVGSDHSEWIWKQICRGEFGFSGDDGFSLDLPSWCLENKNVGERIKEELKNSCDEKSISSDLMKINDWKAYCKDLIKVFNVEGTRHSILDGTLDFNMREDLWSNRLLYDFENYDDFRISFDFFLETGDSEIRIAFSEHKHENDCVLFRISGESDMTGTFLCNTKEWEEEGNIFYQEYSPITFAVWNHIEFHFANSNTIEIIINGESLFGMDWVKISKIGFVGFLHSDYRFDKLFIRNIRGSFNERPIIKGQQLD